jgi:3-hydroxymyristoyl/3-hydroxydecanoyl-(acyl carrier protein) dehydratase
VPAFKLEIVKENKPVICSGQELYKYLPHRPPVLLVDRYYGRDQRASYTGYIPVTGSLFCDSGLFLEEGLIEHMAQSVALAFGAEKWEITGEAVGKIVPEEDGGMIPGFVASFRDINFYDRVQETEDLFTEVLEAFKNPFFSVIQVRSYSKDKLVAEGEMTVVKPAGLSI